MSGKPYFQSSGTFSMTHKHPPFPRKNYEVCIVFQMDDSFSNWTDKKSTVKWKWGSKWPAEKVGLGSPENVLRNPLALRLGEIRKEGSRRRREREGGWKERKIRNKKKGAGKKISLCDWSDQHSTWELARQRVAGIQGNFKLSRTASQGYVGVKLTMDHNSCSQIFHNER